MFPKKKEKPKEHSEQSQGSTQPQQEPVKQEELQKQVEELRTQIEELQKEKDDIFAKLQRVAADYDNYQKRSARQITDSITYEKDKIIKTLLPVLDNFECIIANTSCGVQDEALLKGVQIIYDQMLGVLKGQGVEQIKAAGEKFDPAQHEAITLRNEEGKEDGAVLEELQKGYVLNGRVIRPSRVVVNKAPAAEAEQAEEEETKDTQ
ncbi:MAG: nucleotide exchange factor GrpE [Sedimentisphaerales bacterium]|nr:nucleotide exchange factor GrpE [Sedimentisphaerales bacterium]